MLGLLNIDDVRKALRAGDLEALMRHAPSS